VRTACSRAGQFCPQLDSPTTQNQSFAAISQDLSTFRFGTAMALRVRAARDPTNDIPLRSHEPPWEAMLNQCLHDLRYASRMLLRAPAFAAVAILTLALGIGANTAIFTIVNALLLRPLPYGDPARLVTVWQDMRARGGPADEWATPGNYADWRREPALFQSVAVIGGWRPTLTGDAEAEPIPGEQVSHQYFDVLGVPPALGRSFRDQDDVPNAERVAIISDRLWKRRFGGDGTVIGRRIRLNGEAHEIIGVLPAMFRPVSNASADIWRPLRLNVATPSRGTVFLRTVARLAPGVSHERAQTDATALASRLEAEHPAFNEKVGFMIVPLHDRVVGDIRGGLFAIVGAVTFVLLIACANLANLLMARASSRGRELAVRVALGAGRTRVIRQLLTESLLLAVLGGTAGVVIGVWLVDALLAIAPADAPRLNEVRFHPVVFAFAAALTVLTGLLFGLVPALHSSRSDVTGPLKDGGRGSAGAAGRGVRRALVAAEVALALVLLTGGGLLLQTFVGLQAADLGFDPRGVLTGFVSPPRAGGYDTMAKHRAFYDQVLERAGALPGVRQAALTSVLPLSGDSDMDFRIEGRAAPPSPSQAPVTWYRLISAGYFDVMGMRLVQGRSVAEREAAASVVVNETFGRTYFPGDEPIGRRIRFRDGPDDPWFTIVGIAADVRGRGARETPRAEIYLPYWQFTEPGMNVILKVAGDPALLSAPLRRMVGDLDRSVPVAAITTLEAVVAASIEQPRFLALLAGAFALLALTLAAIGLYGVMAYTVSQRTVEIGVRMALGASPAGVFRLVVGEGLRLTAVGIALGVAGSVAVGRLLTTLLFGVGPGDPRTFAVTAVMLVMVGAVACVIPARRATRVDPMVALRAE
jgi:putative ABC transport system permease protein